MNTARDHRVTGRSADLRKRPSSRTADHTVRASVRIAGSARARALTTSRLERDAARPPVFAVVPGSAAAWLLGRLEFAGVTDLGVRNEVAWLRGKGAARRAAQMELAWSQLLAAAEARGV